MKPKLTDRLSGKTQMFRDDDGRSSRANLQASVHTPAHAAVASPR